MNRQAAEHLAKAADLITRADSLSSRSDDYYHKAADEILKAKSLDSNLSMAVIGSKVGKSGTWVGNLLDWDKGGRTTKSPVWKRGSHATNKEIQEGVDNYLHNNPGVVAQKIADNPKLIEAIARNKGLSGSIIEANLNLYPSKILKNDRDRRGFVEKLDDLHVEAIGVANRIAATWQDEASITDDASILEQARDAVGMTVKEFNRIVTKAVGKSQVKGVR